MGVLVGSIHSTISLISSVIVVLNWMYRQKLAVKHSQLDEQLKLELERKRIAKDLHDDLGTGLTQIIMLNEMALMDLSKRSDSTNYLKQVSEISRNLVSNMNDLIWVLKPEKESIDSLFAILREKLHRIFDYSDLQLTLKIETEQSSRIISSAVRRHILLLCKELSNNTLKHAKATQVHVEIGIVKDMLLLNYSDNGIGFSVENALGNGNGLVSINDRVSKLQGKMKMISSINNGLHVVIEIPLHLN